ncbi:MAG: thioredoxin family protein [Synergistaceae bacterium]|nr:thioredoxin family protein [Synergistaceae bacterium]
MKTKLTLILLSALIMIAVLGSVASAAAPSVTMLSTQTCPACEQMAKVLNEINATYKGKIKTSHIYLENNPDIAKKYNVRYVPTLIFRDANGNEIAKEVGYRSMSDVIKVFADKGIKI